MGQITSLAMPDNNLIMRFAEQAPQIGQAFDQALQASRQQQVQQYQLGQQLQQAQQLKAAQQAYITNPNAQNLNTLITLDPRSATAIKTGHDALDLDTQKSQLRQATYIRGLIASGKPDQAAAALQQRISADQAAGQDTSDDQHMLELINADPKQAGAAIDYHLASILGPEKFGENFKTFGTESRANAEEPGVLALQPATLAKTRADTEHTKAETQQLTNPRPETAVVTDPTTGQPVFYNKNGSPEAARAAAGIGGVSAPGVPQGIATLVPELMTSENASGDPSAKNPNSSATGNGQFLNGTWLDMVKQNRPDLAQGKSDTQILAMRADPNLSREMTTQYAVRNAGTLQTAGLPVNGATIAMAHKLGPGGAQSVLQADPSAPLSKVLPPQVIAANPQLKGLTAGQYAQTLAQKFGVQPIDAAQADPAATGDEFLKSLPAGRANVIRAMADGRMAVPTGAAARSAANQQILTQLAQYDPNFDFANSSSRRATRLNFTSGKASNEIKALNTAIGHLGALDDAIDGLGNYGLPLNNSAAHLIAGVTGTDARIKKFETTKDAALGEVNKVFVGSAGALADREGWKKQLNAASSPESLHAVVAQLGELLGSRIDALGEQYSQGMGTSKSGIELLTPHAKAAFANLGKSHDQRAAPAAPGQVQATDGDVALLRKNPQLAAKFDQLYGAGASSQYLGAR